MSIYKIRGFSRRQSTFFSFFSSALDSMLQYPTVAEKFSASRLPCLAETSPQRREANSPCPLANKKEAKTETASTSNADDVFDGSSSSSLESSDQRARKKPKGLNNAKEGEDEKEKEKERRRRRTEEGEEEDAGDDDEESEVERKDLSCTRGDEGTRLSSETDKEGVKKKKKYPLEILLSLFVNPPLEVESSGEAVKITRQSTEWMMELSSLLKILRHTPVEVGPLPLASPPVQSLFFLFSSASRSVRECRRLFRLLFVSRMCLCGRLYTPLHRGLGFCRFRFRSSLS